MHLPRPASLLLSLALLPAILAAAETPLGTVIRESFDTSAAQYSKMLEFMQGKSGFPRTVDKGEVKLVKVSDWTSGFFPGSLWYLFEATGDAKWREAARTYTAGVEAAKNSTGTHDVGFILNCSFGNGLRLTGDTAYRDVMLQGAASLSTRFKPEVGCILSWNPRNNWKFPVIIDNMMNLELLTWASRTGGNPKFRDIAVKHADTTLRHHFRPDNSSFHVVDYDPANGQVKVKQTHQGAAHDSAWARGQSWGLYGYTMMYRETRNPAYLAQARKIAAFLMSHPRLPADKVPYWDYDAPGIPNAPRDSSAAAIMSSALFELSTLTNDDMTAKYRAFATQQLRSLCSPAYRAKVGENGHFLLMHATGHLPGKSEIDVPINYGDYYFLEALHRARKLEGKG
jgi:rhamnogalacturonyl hydrolase YesR